MLDNKDIWMDGEEVVKRVNAKIQKNKAQTNKTTPNKRSKSPVQ
jgi:hypothetical protein